MSTAQFTDDEFGIIEIRRIKTAKHIKISVTPKGSLRATTPPLTPVKFVRTLINSSRPKIRTLVEHSSPQITCKSGMRVGKTHSLIVKPGVSLAVTRHGSTITATHPDSMPVENPELQAAIRKAIIQALRREAKQYLPDRLQILARTFGYHYSRVRFSHAGTRWGSCSSRGTISLNIALMKLPFELIDYVLIHELCHTKQMNHSKEFWKLVAEADPAYKQHIRAIKKHTPTI